MTVVECLIAARKRIENPANWGKGGEIFEKGGKECAGYAILRSCDDMDTSGKAFALFASVTNPSVVLWNDAPERTHAEVLAAFDRAIDLGRDK